MTHDHEPRHHEPLPIIAYIMLALVAMCVLAGIGVMWGITQDAGWHGFGGAITLMAGVLG
jgi:hypothetical protein